MLLLATWAVAGTGPWTLPEAELSVYGGAEYQRIGTLAGEDGSGAEVIPVDSGLEKAGGTLIVGYGVRDRVDVELQLPYTFVTANRKDGALCSSIGLRACDTTQGLGIVTLKVKGLLLDELVGPPVSLSLGAELRLGQTTSATRARLTNLGEGTTDIGGFLDVGRSGGLGDGYWSAYLEIGGRYRFPNTDLLGTPIPGAELHADLEWLGGAQSWWAVGPALSLLWRPEGVDVADIDFTDPDRFGSLRVFNLRAGGKVIIRSSRRTSLSIAAYGTAYAWNNPADQIVVTAGLGGQIGTRSAR